MQATSRLLSVSPSPGSIRTSVLTLACVSALLTAPDAAAQRAPTWPDLTAPAKGASPAPGDAAVLIGVEDYLFVSDVQGAVRNTADWYTWLRKSKRLPLSHVALVRDHDATKEGIMEAAERARSKVKPGGTLWFVFVGHGAPSKDGQDGLLVGADAQQKANSLYARSVPLRSLLDTLQRGQQANTVVIVDACFSGRTTSGAPLVRNLQPLIPTRVSPSTPNTLVFTAAESQQFAGPLPNAKRPAFSYLMLGALRGWADANGDRAVTAQEAIDYTTEIMTTMITTRRQNPGLTGAPPHTTLAAQAAEPGPDIDAMRLGRSTTPSRATPPPTPLALSPTPRRSTPPNLPQLNDGDAQDTNASNTAALSWLGGGIVAVGAGIPLDTSLSTSTNGSFDAMDLAPVALYTVGTSAILYGLYKLTLD